MRAREATMRGSVIEDETEGEESKEAACDCASDFGIEFGHRKLVKCLEISK